MKTKKLEQKMIINKQTVANLEDIEMKESKGGGFTTGCTSPTYTIYCWDVPHEMYCCGD